MNIRSGSKSVEDVGNGEVEVGYIQQEPSPSTEELASMKIKIGKLTVRYLLLSALVAAVAAIVMFVPLPEIVQDLAYLLTISIVLYFGIGWAIRALRIVTPH